MEGAGRSDRQAPEASQGNGSRQLGGIPKLVMRDAKATCQTSPMDRMAMAISDHPSRPLLSFGALSQDGVFNRPLWHADPALDGRRLLTGLEQVVHSDGSPSYQGDDAVMLKPYWTNILDHHRFAGYHPQPFRLYIDLVWDAVFVPNASINLEYVSPRDKVSRCYWFKFSMAEPPRSDLGWHSLEQAAVCSSGPAR
ncbi:hypothetical protein PG997_000162 [Apiospora hydei]|uniref:Uncharacterized protein n=1 Tax=Apiospora hydei TaxID=1337664 RepID=A0ABR1X9Z4_9PEZI